jgi:hypothetical protein
MSLIANIFLFLIIYFYISTCLYAIAFSLKVNKSWKSFVPLLNIFYIPEIAGYKKGGWVLFYIVLILVISTYLLPILQILIGFSEKTFLFIYTGLDFLFEFALIVTITFWYWKIFNRKNYSGITSLFFLGWFIPNLTIGIICYVIFLISLGIIAFSEEKK